MENSQLRADLERLRQAVAGGGEGEENMAVREISGRGGGDIPNTARAGTALQLKCESVHLFQRHFL